MHAVEEKIKQQNYRQKKILNSHRGVKIVWQSSAILTQNRPTHNKQQKNFQVKWELNIFNYSSYTDVVANPVVRNRSARDTNTSKPSSWGVIVTAVDGAVDVGGFGSALNCHNQMPRTCMRAMFAQPNALPSS